MKVVSPSKEANLSLFYDFVSHEPDPPFHYNYLAVAEALNTQLMSCKNSIQKKQEGVQVINLI